MDYDIIGLPLDIALQKIDNKLTYKIEPIDTKDKSQSHKSVLVVNMTYTGKNSIIIYTDQFKIDI